MEWTASGRIVAVRPHGETSAVIEVLTAEHGRHAGLVRGGRSKAMRPILQPGNRIRAVWRARLESHLGGFAVEAEDLSAGVLMEDPLALSGLNAACAMARACCLHNSIASSCASCCESITSVRIESISSSICAS